LAIIEPISTAMIAWSSVRTLDRAGRGVVRVDGAERRVVFRAFLAATIVSGVHLNTRATTGRTF
jgi:hypothetical protein